MTQQDAQKMAEAALREWGLWAKGWRLGWMTGLVEIGRCNYTRKLVLLSKCFVFLNDQGIVLDTVLHEIAHALAGPGAHHRRAWKATCTAIGARPKVTYSRDTVMMPEGRYVCTCIKCGADAGRRHRLPPRWRWLMHRGCGGAIEFTDTEGDTT